MGKRRKNISHNQRHAPTLQSSAAHTATAPCNASTSTHEDMSQSPVETAENPSSSDRHEVAMAEKQFEEELCWCVAQLELGLEHQKPNSRQAMEAQKMLRILKSTKAPLIKKRQAMRNMFGDYRKQMKASQKTDKLQVSISSKTQPADQKVVRFSTEKRTQRLASSKPTVADPSASTLTSDPRSLPDYTDAAGQNALCTGGEPSSQTPFKFGFYPEDADIADGDDTESMEPCSSASSSEARPRCEPTLPIASYFRRQEPSAPFCFDFSPADMEGV